MSKPKAKTRNPRITVHKNGLATLSGIHFGDLHALLTTAAVRCHDARKEALQLGEPKDAQFFEELLRFITLAEKSVTRNAKPPVNLRDMSAFARLDLVTVQASTRKHIERVVGELREERRKKIAKKAVPVV